jgi:hypothetical protein
MTVRRSRPQHGRAGAVQPRPARDYPAIREPPGRGAPRSPRLWGMEMETSRTSTIREALRGVSLGTNPRWGSTPLDYPAIREPSRRPTPLVPRVLTPSASGTSTIRKASRRPAESETGAR